MRKILVKMLILMAPLLLAISCKDKQAEDVLITYKNANDFSSLPFNPSDSTATVDITIYVTDSSRNAVTGAELVVNGTTYTLSAGVKEQTITGISIKEAPHLSVQAPGYMTKHTNIFPMDCKTGIEIILQPMEKITNITNTAGGSVLAKAGTVTFDANALVNQNNSPYTGDASIGLRVSDVNRDYLDIDGKIEVASSDLTMYTKDSSGNLKMAVMLATMQVQANDASGNALKLDPAKPATVSLHINDKFLELLNGTSNLISKGFATGAKLPLVTKDKNTGQWNKTDNTCTMTNQAGKTYCVGQVTTLEPVAVSYESSIGCIKAEVDFSIPNEKSVVSRKYSISNGYKLHTYAAANGKVGLVAVVPTDTSGAVIKSYDILSEYSLQKTSEMTNPVDPFAGSNYSQLDTVPLVVTSAVLTGNEGSSVDAALEVCSMDAASLTIKAPEDLTTEPDGDPVVVDPGTVFQAKPVLSGFIGTWSVGPENDGSNDKRVVQVIDSTNTMYTSEIVYSSNDLSCDPATKQYEYKSVANISNGAPSGVFYSDIEAVKFDILPISLSLTPLSDDMVTYYNSVSWCGFNNWEKNVEKDVTGKWIDGTSITYSTSYDLAWVNAAGDIAYAALTDGTYDGTTDALRPVNLKLIPINRQ